MAGKLPVRPPTIRDPKDRFQRETNRAVKAVQSTPQDNRVYTKSLTIGTSSTPCKHGLGKIPTGWHVSDNVTGGVVVRDANTPMTADTINLAATIAGVYDIVFF